MDPELFPELPEDLSALSDEELADLRTRYSEAARIVAEGTADVGELSAQEVLDRLTQARADYQTVVDEQSSREAGREAFAEQAETLAAEMGVEVDVDVENSGDGAGESDDADESSNEAGSEDAGEADAADAAGEDASSEGGEEEAAASETEELAASARPAPRLPARPRRLRPIAGGDDGGAVLVASADIRGSGMVIRRGETLDRARLGQALAEAWHHAPDNGTRTFVASAEVEYPAERRLLSGDPEGNAEKIRAVTDPANHQPDTLLASGGLCAPFTPIYDLPLYATADRPVRDSLAGYQAERGGITYPAPLGLADAEDAITVVTAANDELGGTFAAKACLVLDCDPFNEAVIEALAACVQWGNFNARAWPERVANLADLAAAQHAKIAEIELLDAIGAGSTAVNDEQKYGAVSTLLQGILKAAAAMRSRHRMSAEQTLRVLLPSWVPDLMLADLAHGQFDRFHARSEMAAILGRANIAATFYLDTETGEGQIFAAQSAGNLLEFPLEATWYLFPEGAWLFLDGGRLDLGVVRDSVLNETNDFQVFYETFEGAALVGIESLKVTSTVCPDGTVAAPETAFSCST